MFSGTHQGEFMGIAATGKPVKIKCIWIHRVADHRIVEGMDWGIVDMLAMMRQLGVAP
jgi:predicted ester cyclase